VIICGAHGRGIRADLLPPNNSDIEEDSPYPEVRAAVSNFDDPEMPVNTFRMWLLGIIWCIILAYVSSLVVSGIRSEDLTSCLIIYFDVY
jgi:hypothetical protein